MRLLFDANISRKIVPMLDDLFPGSSQVTLLGLSGETPDETIWEVARKDGFVIVTADIDFFRLSAVTVLRPRSYAWNTLTIRLRSARP